MLNGEIKRSLKLNGKINKKKLALYFLYDIINLRARTVLIKKIKNKRGK